jgi:hypothetical protein
MRAAQEQHGGHVVNLHHPVQSLQASISDAIDTRLRGVPSDLATTLLGPSEDGSRTRRPKESECFVTMFAQSWRGADLEFRHGDLQQSIDGETVVVIGPMHDAAVYFVGQFAYHVASPNRQFFLDVAAHHMAARAGATRYDGRDDCQIESLPYDVEAAMARAQAVLEQADPAHARLISGLLRDLASRFDRATTADMGEEAIEAR